MKKKTNIFSYIIKSKFIRSIFFRLVAIFAVFVLLISMIVYFSFSTELNKNMINEKEKQLESISSTLSNRLKEISDIAYSISNDSTFRVTESSLGSTNQEIT